MGIEKVSDLETSHRKEQQPFSVVKGGLYPKEESAKYAVSTENSKQQIQDLKEDIVRTAWYEQMKSDGYDTRDIPKEKTPILSGTLGEKNIQLEQLINEYHVQKSKEGLFAKLKSFFKKY